MTASHRLQDALSRSVRVFTHAVEDASVKELNQTLHDLYMWDVTAQDSDKWMIRDRARVGRLIIQDELRKRGLKYQLMLLGGIILLALIVLGLTGCDTKPTCYPPGPRDDFTAFKFNATGTSPVTGVQMEGELDTVVLERVISRVSECVARLYPQMGEEERVKAYCLGTPTLEVRTCLQIKKAEDWRFSCSTWAGTTHQVFSCNAPDESCLEKGETPTAECPCSCRAIIQGNDLIITAPDMELLPAQLTQLITGCDHIWNTRLKECGNPALRDP